MVVRKIKKPSARIISTLSNEKVKRKRPEVALRNKHETASKKIRKRIQGKSSTALKDRKVPEPEPTIQVDETWWNNPEKYISDGRVFEADREMVLSEEEEAEVKRFKMTLKYYHDTSRRLLKNAIAEELAELKEGKKLGYFEGSIADRIQALREEERLIDNAEIMAHFKENH